MFLTEGPGSPSTRFAVTSLLPLLESRGVRCTVSHRRPEKYALVHLPWCDFRPLRVLAYCAVCYPYSLFRRLIDAFRAGRHDVTFLQRDLDENHTSAWLERLFRRRSKHLVFYFDDALWLAKTHQGRPLENKIREIIRMADSVVVSHAFLAEYAGRFNPSVQILPLSIDTGLFSPRRPGTAKDRVTVGWTGGPWNYPEILALAGPLGEIRREERFEILIQSGSPPPAELQRLGVRYLPWEKDREIDGLREMDIGICPLLDTPWARGKFSFKLLQYMSAGLPVVCSDVGANREIVLDGLTGYVVRGQDEWRSRILDLVRHKELRESLGRAARARALAVFPREKAAARLADLLFSEARGAARKE